MRRAVLLLLGIAALLLTPGAPGDPDVDGDPTPPVVAPVITGTLGAAGWYTSNVTVNWSVTDPESIILSTSGCDARTLSTDTLSTRLTCAATSDGGEATVSKTFKVDKTAPGAGATPSRGADVNGWYNHELSVGFAGSDATSGLESCSAAQSYGGPDTAGGALNGTCRDNAGNVAAASFAFKYDETAPQASPTARAPDANGWYNHALTVTYQGADGTSGVGSCTETTYAGPDDPSVALAGTCIDRAGNQSGASVLTLKYDETAPQATATASRAADQNGWYNHPLTVSFTGQDATAGLDSCDPPATYVGPDAASTSVTGACRDRAGNVAPRAYTLKYDATPPQATATPSRQPNANGWYRAPLTVAFAATDPVSGTASCAAAKSYGGPDDSSAVVTGTCVDTAGNAGTAAFPLKYDATAPQTTANPSRPPNANGWYRAPLAVTFAGADTTSGIDSCDAAQSYAGPDTASATTSGVCRDRAGNSTGATFALKYDATAPQVTTAPGRAAGTNGWYNAPLTVSFTGGDATSGVDSCDAAKTYSGPDNAAATVTGSCLDRAGNGGSASLPLKYDATAPQATATPSRQANSNGWHNAPVTVTFAGTDATAGVDTCDPARSYSGPDTASTALSGTCRDKAGNASGASMALKYDATAPTASASPSRQPNANGWYNAPLTVSFAASDATSGLDSCPAARTYLGPDDAAAAVSGSCVDKAGNSGLASLLLKYDATAPAASASPSRQPNANGWYNAALTVTFAATDATSKVDSCQPPRNYSGPDASAASVAGTCVDKAGNGGTASFPFSYDATAPQAAAAPSRPPNANGWYRAPLAVTYSGSDALSGVAGCDAQESYAGPDSSSAALTGNCFDRAGNAAATSFPFKFDSTAPQATATPSRASDTNGWYNHALTVSFAATDATAGLQACDPTKSYAGPDGAAATVSGACSDLAGNVGSAVLPLKYDATAPQVGAAASRPPNANGWHNAALTVSFSGTDATAGIDTCDAAKAYSGPDTAAATISGSCRDKAGNGGGGSLTLKFDATKPQVTAAAERAADANGWFNAPVKVGFTGGDATSGVGGCDAPARYAGPDSAATSVTGSCRDKADNVGLGSFPLKYDATPPQATAVPSRQPNANGWHNAPFDVSFAATDSLSGLESCPQPQRYAGPDTPSGVVSGTCLDRAGNGAPASFALRYDATAPETTASSREPDGHGWYRRPLTVIFSGADAISGVETCSAPSDYVGPDTANGASKGFCRDRAGNESTEATFSFKYDATAPQVTEALAIRPPDRLDWYNRPIAFAVQGTDGTSGLDTCSPVTYAGPDSGAASVTGTCFDRAGNSGARSFALRFDGTGPEARAIASRAPDANDWYRASVTVSFAGEDAVSGLESCDASTGYDGPDSAVAELAGVCVDRAGNASVASLPLHFDATAPQVTTVSPERPPDANGWYNRRLAVRFHGADATSGIDSCTEVTYAGPDAGAVSLGGFCRDVAGNASAGASFALRYDATAPHLAAVTATPGNRTVALSWMSSPDTSGVEIRRSGKLVYQGSGLRFTDTGLENGTLYRYTLTAYDEARNKAEYTVTARPSTPLVSPPAGARVSAPPRLVWTSVPNATYYNVQVWRRGRILSAWPVRSSFRLTRTWTYAGRRHKLLPGRYRWYVWPGYGRRASKRFGPLLGASSFVVR